MTKAMILILVVSAENELQFRTMVFRNCHLFLHYHHGNVIFGTLFEKQ